MKLDNLPTEILDNIFGYLDKDVIQVYQTNRTLHNVASYDGLWRPLCEKLFRRIQWNDIPLSFRQTFLEQQRINQHVQILLDRVALHEHLQDIEQIVSYGVRARDKLLQVLDQQRPGIIPSSPTYNMKHNYWARQILTMIKHHEAMNQLQDIAKCPQSYNSADLFTVLDGFYEPHVLNPNKNEIFEDLVSEMDRAENEDNTSRNTTEHRAITIAERLFCSSKTRNHQARSRSFLSAILEDGMPGNDTVNVCIYSHIGARLGLEISPVLLRQNGHHVSSNFARVEDPSRRDGFFIINILSQMVISGQGLMEMLEHQRFVQLVSTKPTLKQIAIANATHPPSKHDLISENAYLATAMSKLACVILFDDREEVWRAAAADPRFSALQREDVLEALNGGAPKFFLPETVQDCSYRGQVISRIRGGRGVVVGYEPTRDRYKVIDENELSWYMTKDEIRVKARILTPAYDLVSCGSNIYNEALGSYFSGYDEDKFIFV